MISLVTNASLADAPRIRRVIPHWLRVFHRRISELVIVFDPVPASGRIRQLHGTSTRTADEIRDALREVSGLDSRVRVVDLPPPGELEAISRTWFHNGHPIRCQAGTPILAFLYAIEQGQSKIVIRADCDILIADRGWVDMARSLIEDGAADFVEPPRLGGRPVTIHASTRILMMSPRSLRERGRLPIHAHRLDWLRRLHRACQGRPPWLALEQSLQAEVDAGRLTYRLLESGGYALHVARTQEMDEVAGLNVIERIERDDLPLEQRNLRDFSSTAWQRAA